MLSVFSGGIDTETNTFTSLPTGRRSFEEVGIWHGNAAEGGSWLASVPRTFAHCARLAGYRYMEGLYAAAEPGGPVVRSVYEQLRDELLEEINRGGPFDIVLLHLHGAMVAQGYEDCEGDILRRVRARHPSPRVLAAVLDPHCHLSQAMVEHADILIACKEFPHDDYADSAQALFDLAVRTARREVSPVAAVFDCKMVGLYPTTDEPMSGIVRSLREAEGRASILSVSLIHGFPWGDTADNGSKVLVYADGNLKSATDSARSLGESLYAQRRALLPRYPTLDAALDEAAQTTGTVVLADTADNPGGGAPGDNVTALRTVLDRALEHVALGGIWDPQVALMCAEAGVGATLLVRLGGKTSLASGNPLDVEVRVQAIKAAHQQTSLGGSQQPLGLSAWLAIGSVDVVVTSIRSQVYAPDLFTGLGIDLPSKRLVIVKSTNHFYSRFASLATRVIRVATPGALPMDFAAIPYQRRALDYFPRVEDPLHLERYSFTDNASRGAT